MVAKMLALPRAHAMRCGTRVCVTALMCGHTRAPRARTPSPTGVYAIIKPPALSMKHPKGAVRLPSSAVWLVAAPQIQ